MQAFEQILAVATLIVQFQNGQQVGHATGFFYGRGPNVFLVTNRHVVVDEQKKHKPDSLRLRLHVDDNLLNNTNFDVSLYRNGKALWHAHPNYSPSNQIDLAVIELDVPQLVRHKVKALSKRELFPDQYLIPPGQDIMVLGYPLGIHDQKHNLPIMRNAMVSSQYGVDFNGFRYFLIDANLHPGSSGSPVFTKVQTTWHMKNGATGLGNSAFYFLGVHSSTLHLGGSTNVAPVSVGLSTVWYASLIEDIISTIIKN